ncbi:MAG: flagellar hook-associated protein FlgK [Armatimonadota bacterium]|jgi:flagellar hook-associated protein 1 FlgK
MGTFTSLTTAASGMHAARAAMEIIANNIANANTPGFKRQAPIFAEGNPPTGTSINSATAGSFTGTGVQLKGIRRVQDAFLDMRINAATQSKAQWSVARDLLTAVESQFNELGDNGLAALLDKFWNQWRELAANPEGLPPRSAVVASADILANRIREIYANIRAQQTQMNSGVATRVDQINRIARDIAEVNEKIVALEHGGFGPNDLLNRRDQLVEELSALVNVSAHGNSGSDFILNIGGHALVQGTFRREITVEQDASGAWQPVWADGMGRVAITSGELRGLLDIRDSAIPQYLGQLDTIANTLIQQVNALHRQGYGMAGTTGVDFFAPGTGAATLRVNQQLLDDPSLVAASATGEPGNTAIAQAIADLSEVALIGGETISQSYRSLVTGIGGDLALAERSALTREFTLQQLVRQRESVSGVSLDEELADMVRYQQSFAASARIFEATNYILQVLLEQVGVR